MLQGLKDTIRTRALLALCSAILTMWLYRQAWCFYHRKTPGKDLVPAESVIVSLRKQGTVWAATLVDFHVYLINPNWVMGM